jgi:uncharacterized protein (TIGR00297 family)
MEIDGTRVAIGFGVNLAFALLAYAARTVGPSGVAAGTALGTLVFVLRGWQGWLVLAAFFVVGSGLTKFGAKEKEARGIAEAEGGRRGAKNALAKVTPGLLAAILGFTLGDLDGAFAAAFVATFATAAADTAGTEVGKAIGKTPILLTTFRRVPPGTIGAVSVEGTVAGLLAAAALAVLAAALSLYTPVPAWQGALVVVAAAFGGNVFESWINAVMARRRKLNHELSNFLLCVAGGLLAFALVKVIQ